jgi:endoglucanase
MKSLIQKLVETTGPSGFEKEIRAVIRAEIEPLADEIRVDALGNLIARKGTRKEGGKRIMLSAHMDEIGVMVTHVDENGFARFTNIGGVYPRNCAGGRVLFTNETRGVIGMEKLDSKDLVPGLDKMYIDVGASSRETCPVKVGDTACFDRPFVDLGDRMVSKAMDNRISVAVLIETMRLIKESPNELYFVFSTQEEVGLRGATTAAFGVDPDLGLAVDVTGTGDTPKCLPMEVSLGKGPTVKVRDGAFLADPRVVDWMAKTAEAEGIPYQLEVLEAGTTDAHAIQLSRAGVPAGCISIPCRYIHSPSEMVDTNDVTHAARFAAALINHTVTLAE